MANPRNFDPDFTRTIVTVYYINNRVVKRNTAKHANRAVLHCVNHMQLNIYEATVAEVYDEKRGVLHCVVKRKINGDIVILYRRKVKENY